MVSCVCFVPIRLCVGWKYDLFFFSFFSLSSLWLLTSFCVRVNIRLTPLFYPQPPHSESGSWYTWCFFLFASFPSYMFLLYVCLYINLWVCVSVAMWLGLKLGLWSRRWQTAAPRRNPPAGWNVGEKLSGGRIIVRRVRSGTSEEYHQSSSFSEHYAFYIARILERKETLNLIIRCLVNVEDPECRSVNHRPTGNPPSFPSVSEMLYLTQHLSILCVCVWLDERC